jgi:hypothetical protein
MIVLMAQYGQIHDGPMDTGLFEDLQDALDFINQNTDVDISSYDINSSSSELKSWSTNSQMYWAEVQAKEVKAKSP